MKKAIILVCMGVFFLQSCKKETTIDIGSIKIAGVSLNNGKLWSANKETTDGIKKMNQIIDSFSEDADAKAYQQLKVALETQFTNIFSKCTMKGDAHEQLHNYLKPMIDYFNNLETNDATLRSETYQKLKLHVLGYVNYFE